MITANWSVPEHVVAITTCRSEGHSCGPYAKNNLALHVGDEEDIVLKNRQQLKKLLDLPAEPDWLDQTHSTDCVIVEETSNRKADAAITRTPGRVLAIMTADCLPIMICDQKGTEIAAIHAGWRGLADGIVEKTLATMQTENAQLIAWIGPAICQQCFEIGKEVRDIFLEHHPGAEAFFAPKGEKWLADLPHLAQHVLIQNGLSSVFQSNICTFEENVLLYSYRKEAQTGRMATLIWLKQQQDFDHA